MVYKRKKSLSLLFFMLPLAGCGVTLSLPSFWKTDNPTTASIPQKRTILIREEDEVIVPEKPSDEELTTGSITPRVKLERFQPAYLKKEDWAHVKAALFVVSETKEQLPSTAYENEESGTFGTLTITKTLPNSCRAFLGSSVLKSGDYWFEGTLCKNKQGVWELTKLETHEKKS
jgi:17 kDa outer membrane surface antigen